MTTDSPRGAQLGFDDSVDHALRSYSAPQILRLDVGATALGGPGGTDAGILSS